MKQLHDYREQLKIKLSHLKDQIELAETSGLSLQVPDQDDELHELVSALNTYLRKNRDTSGYNDARCIWTPDDNTIHVTEELLSLYGLELNHNAPSTLEELLEKVIADDRDLLQQELLSCYSEGRDLNLFYRIRKGDNTMRIIHSEGKVLRNSSGTPEKMSVILRDVTEKLPQKDRFHILLDSCPDAILLTDKSGYVKEWNRKASLAFQWNDARQDGCLLPFLISAAEIKDLIQNSDAEAESKHYLTAIRKDGTTFPAEVTLSPIDDGRERMNLVYIRDITDQRIGESMLREKEELYRTVVESLFEGLIITDTNDRITFVNSRFEKLSGYKSEELVGKIEYEILHAPVLHESIRNRMENRLAGLNETYELQFIRKDGSVFTGRVNAAPYRNANGEIIGTVGAITDITTQKRDAELERLVIAATKSFNSVMITDKQGNIEWTNEGFTKLTGYSLDEVKGTRGEILRRTEEGGLANHEQLLEELQKRKEPLTFESKNFTKSGTAYWSITTLTPVLNEQNEVEKIISIDSDITLRKKMEEQLKLANRIAENSLIKGNRALSELTLAKQALEESMRAKEQFLAHISHEIRTPMNGIIGLTDILLKSDLQTEQREYLQAIKRSGDTLMVVINDILDLSKIEAGKMTFEEIPFRINNILNPLIDLFLPKARQKNIRIIKNVSHDFPEILMGDPLRLNQVIMNLVSNAVKFTEKGYIEISAAATKHSETEIKATIRVKDTGLGIQKSKIPSLFLDFTQAGSDVTRKYGGTGLGLSISKRLVELQGGSVSVESEEGKGSIFTVELIFRKPPADIKLTDEKEAEAEIELNQLNGVNVLLVEDNPVNQLLAEKLLSDWGCNISIADNGRIALEKLETNVYDIILMDIKMPEMDGYEATKRIRQMKGRAGAIPIVALTAHAAMWEAEKCIESGMNGYISKPFNVNDLYRMIRSNLNNETMSDQTDGSTGDSKRYTDLTFLKSIAKGSNEFMNKIINSFIKQTGEELKKMQAGLAHKDWDAIHSSAHKIKPSLHFVGISELKDPILTLEKSAKERSNLDAVPALVQKVTRICEQAISELNNELDTLNISE